MPATPQTRKSRVLAPREQDPADISRAGKAAVQTAVSLGQFPIQLDLTIVNVALSSIGAGLGGTGEDRQHGPSWQAVPW